MHSILSCHLLPVLFSMSSNSYQGHEFIHSFPAIQPHVPATLQAPVAPVLQAGRDLGFRNAVLSAEDTVVTMVSRMDPVPALVWLFMTFCTFCPWAVAKVVLVSHLFSAGFHGNDNSQGSRRQRSQ